MKAHLARPARLLGTLDDTALVARVTEGDDRALEALYGRYGRACFRLARRILADDQLAQDVVQEVFLGLWRDAHRFDTGRGTFSTWLLSATHHKSVDAVRREENHRKHRARSQVLQDRTVDEHQVHDAVWSTLRGERVRAALQTLPEVQKEALFLGYFGGHTQREIARITGTPLGTVKTRTLSGLRRLRDDLQGLQTTAPEALLTGAGS